ncbi:MULTISPECIES: hypothetical protein [Jannaschia]|uniref:hypothetical protein n=1 Tax=Jannaschia TaxID=188905 RepID=UPI001C7E16C1|nr:MULTISPECIES: hypothetical protein [unclassified Jannaschia]
MQQIHDDEGRQRALQKPTILAAPNNPLTVPAVQATAEGDTPQQRGFGAADSTGV